MGKKGAIDSVRLNVVHHPGRHCASTGIRDLVNFHGIDFSEAMCFGIGAGLGLWYLDFEGLPVSRMMHVRSMDFEAQFFSRMGMAFEWEQRDDPAAGEAALCHHLDNGRPAIVQTDIYHLPHYSGNTHFPGHLITVWGYDGTQGVFFITDTQFPDLIAVPFAGRNPPITRWRLKGFPNKTDDMVCEYFKQTCNTVTLLPFRCGQKQRHPCQESGGEPS
jgi:hypothetical protein